MSDPDARERRIAEIAQRVNEASDEHRDGLTLDYAVSMALCEDVNWLLRELAAVDSLRADAQRTDEDRRRGAFTDGYMEALHEYGNALAPDPRDRLSVALAASHRYLPARTPGV